MNRIFGKVFTATNLIVTNHAKDRLLQRSRLFLRQHEKDDPKSFIQREFLRSVLDNKIIMSPFCQHKLETKYGIGSFRTKSKDFEFMGKYDCKTDTTVITSVFYNQKLKVNK